MEWRTRNLFKLICAILVAGCCIGGCRQKEWQKSSGAAWATAYHITYRSDISLEDSIQAVIAAVNSSLSVFEANSTISRINRNEDVTVDSLNIEVFEMSMFVNSLSNGAFDPTVSPAIDFWGFGYRQIDNDYASLDSIRSLVGLNDCLISDGRILKKSPDTEFNFSAIAKGYGCDLIGRMFRRNGVDDFLVEIGGEISAYGLNPQGRPWKIGIVTPEGFEGEGLFIGLRDCGMATSGNYRNFRETETGQIGHTINPRTCLPVENGVFSATVIAQNAMFADALATACMVLQPLEAIGMINGIDGAEVMLIVKDTDRESDYGVEMSEGFKNYIYDNQKL